MKKSLLVFIIAIMAGAQTALATATTHFIDRFSESDGHPQEIVTCVTQDAKGYIWISSWNGLCRYDGYRFLHFKARQGDNCPLRTNRILYIRATQGDDILCKCDDGFYLFKTRERRFVALRDKKSDHGDRFRASEKEKAEIGSLPEYKGEEMRILYRDTQGGYWVYTHRGLDRVSFRRGKIAPAKSAASGEEFVRAIFKDKRGAIYVADKNGYVRFCDETGDFCRFLAPNGNLSATRIPFGAKVYSMFEDSRGDIWMGTKPDGLFRLRRAKNGGFIVKSFVKKPCERYSLNCNSIYSIAEDAKGRILLGTYGGGLNIIENPAGESPRFVNRDNDISMYPKAADKIHSILCAGNGILLLGTNNGLFSCRTTAQPKQMRFYWNRRRPADKTSLSDNQIMDFLKGTDGTIYVATYGGGLNIVESRELLSENIAFKALTTDDGMASDVALSLCEDGRRNVWLVSEHTLMEYDTKTKAFSNYSDGIFAGGFSFSEVKPLYLNKKQTLLLGSTQGLISFSTKDSRKSSFVPKIVFDTNGDISLSPEEKSVSIGFAALDYNKNVPIQYAYMLEGIDNRWMYTTDNHVNLTNIPAGTFRLRVRSTNGDGIWTANEACVMVSRTPYFNERPVAWMLYGGIIIALAFIVVKVARYIRRLEKEIRSLRLSKEEKVEYIRLKLGDMIDGNAAPAPESAKKDGFIDNSAFKEKVEKFMKDNLANTELDVMMFAREMGMSRSILYIQIKNVFGCTPNNYIQDFRLNEAERLLREDHNLNISEVAYRCGFSDPKYFSRCFKKAKGCTPSEIRQCR